MFRSVLSLLRFAERERVQRAHNHATLFAEAESALDGMVTSGAARRSSTNIVLEWLRRAEVLTVQDFLEVHRNGKLPELTMFADLLMQRLRWSDSRTPEMLFRELMYYHHHVSYDHYDGEELLASLTAAHLIMKGRENDPISDPGTEDHLRQITVFRIAFILRYQSETSIVHRLKSTDYPSVFWTCVPMHEGIIEFVMHHPDRLDDIADVLAERPGADGNTVLEILTSPARALSEGIL